MSTTTKRSAKPGRKGILRFLAWFFAILIAGSLLLDIPWVQEHFFLPHLTGVAGLTTSALGMLGIACSLNDLTIFNDTFSIRVVKGCDAVYPVLLLWAAILAYPSGWGRKAAGMAIGAALLYILNIVRIVALFYVGTKFPDWFDAAHLYAWQALFIIITLCLWLLWVASVHRSAGTVRG